MNEIISINFNSTDHKVHYSTTCWKTDIFSKAEEKLYQEYPDYKETNNIFVQGGNQILRFKTIEENKIKPGFPVTLIVND